MYSDVRLKQRQTLDLGSFFFAGAMKEGGRVQLRAAVGSPET